MTRYRILDLFCCGGGASAGYDRAGIDVVGVDLLARRGYPYAFMQGDAIDVLRAIASSPARVIGIDSAGRSWRGRDFDAIHASPPCQAFSDLSSLERDRLFDVHPDLIAPTRTLLLQIGKPYVIENVKGSPLRADYLLCGTQFGLGVTCRDGVYRRLKRHRIFETNWPAGPTPRCAHARPFIGVYGVGGGGQQARGYKAHPEEAIAVMQTPWMDRYEVSQAIPPAYAEHIGGHLVTHLDTLRAAA